MCQSFNPGNGTCSSSTCSAVSGSTVTVHCSDGYILQGVATLTCLQNGTWNKPTPHCAVSCSVDPPSNGQCNPCVVASGQQASFTCNDQYSLIGSPNITCLSNGQWSRSPPKCKKHCSALSPPDNGKCQPDGCQGVSGDTVNFDCQEGYQLNGLPSLVCLPNASWNGTVPQCKRKCEKISATGIQCHPSCSGSAGDILQLSCIQGYTLHGVSSLSCDAGGQWNNTLPTCVKSCQTLTPPANGSCDPVTCSGAVGEQITIACNDGYIRHGSVKLSCLKGGIWNDPMPTCKAKCPDFTPPHNGNCNPSCQGSVGDSVTITCNDGFNLTGNNKMTCTENDSNAAWDASTPKCIGSNISPATSSSNKTKKLVGPLAGVFAAVVIIVIVIVAVVSWKFGRFSAKRYKGPVSMTADEQIHFFAAEENNDDDDDDDIASNNINDDDDEILK